MSDIFYHDHHPDDSVNANTSVADEPHLQVNATVSPTAAATDDPYSYYYVHGYADTQDYITAAIPVGVSFFSLFGCYIVMRESWADFRVYSGVSASRGSSGDTNTTGSVALALQSLFTATCYLMYAFALIWGPLPAPNEIDFAWARGTTATCTLQGFFAQFSAVSAVLAHSFIVWMYVVLVKYGWPEQRLRKWLPLAVGGPLLIAFAMAIVPATIGYYNYNSETKCWINSLPYKCETNKDVNCIRGTHASQMMMLFFLLPHWPLLFLNIGSLCLIWCAVRSLENRIGKYAARSATMPVVGPAATDNRNHPMENSSSQQQQVQETVNRNQQQHVEVSVNRSKSKAIATQGILLSLAFIIAFVVSSLEVLFKVAVGWSPYWLAHLSNAFIAIPGVLYGLVFCHPRAEAMRTPEGRWTRRCVLGCFYNGWNRTLEFFFPARTKTRVEVPSPNMSSTFRNQIESSMFLMAPPAAPTVPEALEISPL